MPQPATVCPYCKASVPADALKCQHCGEWLNRPVQASPASLEPSATARAVAKGIKDKEMHEAAAKFFGFVLLVACGILWANTKDFTIAAIVFGIGMVVIAFLFYRE